MVGWASPNGNFHAPNEWMPLANYRGGMDAIVYLWDELGRMTAAEMRARPEASRPRLAGRGTSG